MSIIALFSALYDPHVGGVEKYTKNLALELKRRGHSVYVITSNLAGEKDVEEQEGIEVIKLPCYSLLDGRLPVMKKNRKLKSLKSYIEGIRFDLVIINTRFYGLSIWAARIAAKRRYPRIIIEHGSRYIAFNKRWIDWIVRFYEKGVTARIKKFCKHFYGVSKDASSWLSTFGICSEGEIYNAIDIEGCMKEVDSQKEESPEGFIQDGPRVIYLGRVTERKGILELNEAVFRLGQDFPGIRLWVVGDGDLMERLQKERRETTIVMGALPHAKAMALLSRADVFVLASETEGFPTSVLEAMACKTFVITTFAGGSKEIITDHSYGILMKDNSSQSIYDAIREALENPRYRGLAEEKCIARVKERYSWSVSAEKIEEIINKGLAV